MSRFGDLIGGKESTPDSVSPPELPKVEILEVPEEVMEKPHFENMSKRELEVYGREHGIELDRRHNKKRLMEELEDHLSNP